MARPDKDESGRRVLSMVGSKAYSVTIPIDIVRQLGLKKGDRLIVRRITDRIVIERDRK